jgi:hypothetical protein
MTIMCKLESVYENDVQTVSHTFFENQVERRGNFLYAEFVCGMYVKCMRNVCEMEIYWKFLESFGETSVTLSVMFIVIVYGNTEI